jgi:hypothetical protein
LKVPRKTHAKKDPLAAEIFKFTLPERLAEASAGAERTRLWELDEHRYGLLPVTPYATFNPREPVREKNPVILQSYSLDCYSVATCRLGLTSCSACESTFIPQAFSRDRLAPLRDFYRRIGLGWNKIHLPIQECSGL